MLLNLLVLRARCPKSLVAFYEGLGLKFDEERHGSGPLHHAARQGATVFEIYPCSSDDRSTVATRLGFSVDDVDAACRRALEGCGTLVQEPRDSEWGRRAVVKDPEGHTIELTRA